MKLEMTFDDWCTRVEEIMIHGLDQEEWKVGLYMVMHIDVLTTLYNRGISPSQAVFDVLH